MQYDYKVQRPWVFTEEGTEKLLEMKKKIEAMLKCSGAFRSGRAFGTGDVWNSSAVLDYLVERGEIIEVTDSSYAGQHRVFTKR